MGAVGAVVGIRGRRNGVRSGRDRGAGVVWVVAFMGVVWGVGVAALGVGAARAARHRADSVADLAALGGAGRAIEGRVVACRVAAEVAEGGGARLSRCSVRDGTVDVSVTARFRGMEVVSRARAGPVGSEGVP
ncbi:Rv3654c family TadE-like protein [Actinomadura sp. 21ATH]|uniref:Rv3654c family TadE-like protein n=1 Tax=Actinomadura sp. 21ATH TaxID=1735444 RepID=UPI0035BEFF11